MADTPRIEDLKRRVQSDPASIAFAALAEEYRRAGRFDEAIAACTSGLVRHPSYLSAHVTLGRALIEVGRFEEAKDELEYVLSLAPENLAAIRGLADIHHRRGEDMHAQYAAADQARYGVGGSDSSAPPPAPPVPTPPEPHPFPDAYAAHSPAAEPQPPAESAPAPEFAPIPEPAPAPEAAAIPERPPAPESPTLPDAAPTSKPTPAPVALAAPGDPALERLEGLLLAIMRARTGGAAAL